MAFRTLGLTVAAFAGALISIGCEGEPTPTQSNEPSPSASVQVKPDGKRKSRVTKPPMSHGPAQNAAVTDN